MPSVFSTVLAVCSRVASTKCMPQMIPRQKGLNRADVAAVFGGIAGGKLRKARLRGPRAGEQHRWSNDTIDAN